MQHTDDDVDGAGIYPGQTQSDDAGGQVSYDTAEICAESANLAHEPSETTIPAAESENGGDANADRLPVETNSYVQSGREAPGDCSVVDVNDVLSPLEIDAPDSSEEKDDTEALREANASDTEESSDDNASDEEVAEGSEQLPLESVVEAILFAARDALKPVQIARCVRKGTRLEQVRDAIATLNLHYLETGRAFEIAEVAGKFQLMSRPEYAPHLAKLLPKKEIASDSRKLTPAALDTLSIIAYKQPMTRGEIEVIRGVGCGPVLRALIERGTVRVAGKRQDVIGQPLLYGTTDAFLVEFGLGSLDELPLRSELRAITTPVDSPKDATLPKKNDS